MGLKKSQKLIQSNHSDFVTAQIKQREKLPDHIKNSIVNGDIIIPSKIDSIRSSTKPRHNNSMDFGNTRKENITPYEVLTLIQSSRENASKLQEKIKQSTFHGWMPTDTHVSLDSTRMETRGRSPTFEYTDQDESQPSKMIPFKISSLNRHKSKTSYGQKLNEDSIHSQHSTQKSIRQKGNQTLNKYHAISSKEDSTSRLGSIEYTDHDNMN